MRDFTAFRGRILAVLAAAGVAQGCGGTIATSDGTVEGPPVENGAGCVPVQDLDARLSAAETLCGGGSGFCTPYDATSQCLSQAELAASLRDCATPLGQGTCPAPTDLALPGSCTVLAGTPTLVGSQCCYPAKQLSCAVPGRPLRVNGLVCLPEVVVGRKLPDSSEPLLDTAKRRALAELWCEGGRYEHASVASFARTTLQLLALRAPMELVAASQAASLDEIEHARLCFALASRFAGQELSAGRLSVDDACTEVTLAELAAETVSGGCVGETVAALTASVQLGLATDPDVRAALQQIAEDESRHADLAWQIVAWAWDVGGPEVRTEIASAFRATLAARAPSPSDGAGPLALQSHGHLSLAKERAIRERVLSEVVGPCARVLLAA